jgi:hypothetical protein
MGASHLVSLRSVAQAFRLWAVAQAFRLWAVAQAFRLLLPVPRVPPAPLARAPC